MLGVLAPADWARQACGQVPGAELAAVNGPSSVVVAGPAGALERVAARCAAEGITTQPVEVDYAAHHSQVEAVRAELRRELAPVRPSPRRSRSTPR